MTVNNPNLWPRGRTPYVIVTPSYRDISAGVRALHLLCHALNQVGEKAYLVFTQHPSRINYALDTPVASAQFHDFIAVYPDIVRGDPLNAPRIVRWLLGDPKVTGGQTSFPKEESVWGYSKKTVACGGGDKVLCLPVSDPGIFYTPLQSSIRSGACYYAYKCENIWNEPLKKEHQGATRLQGTPQQIADILRRSEICYVYENSSIILEAKMCGCPVELVYNKHFTEVHTEAEWIGSYDEIIDKFWNQLEVFIKETQAMPPIIKRLPNEI